LKLFIGGITCKTKREDLMALLAPYGGIKSVKIKKNQKGGSKGYCIVTVEDIETAERLLAKGKIWLRERLLSIRQVLSYSQRAKVKEDHEKHRLIIFGFPMEMGKDLKDAIRLRFSQEGSLSYFYYLRVNIERIDHPLIRNWFLNMDMQNSTFPGFS
jgi:RNA recognition motif-containing protein